MAITHSGIPSAAASHRAAFKRKVQASLAALVILLAGGCQATGLSTAVGPSRSAILSPRTAQQVPGMQIIPVTNEVARKLSTGEPSPGFAETMGNAQPIGTTVGVGDSLEVTIWEAPPAVLFGGGTFDTRIESSLQGSRPGTLPESMVGPSGTITVPFAGQIPAAGRTLRQIEQTQSANMAGGNTGQPAGGGTGGTANSTGATSAPGPGAVTTGTAPTGAGTAQDSTTGN